MANKLKTVVTYRLDGHTRDFTIPFEYLARKFVRVTLVGSRRKELELNTDYRFATKTTISLNRAWGDSDGFAKIELRRYTSASERLVDFTDGSILRAYDLNVAQLQTMHIAEEARDLTADTIGTNEQGDLDARGHRIINVADAVDAGDALTFGQLKGFSNNAWQAREDALRFRNEAEGFKTEAAASRSAAADEVGNAKREVANAKAEVVNAKAEVANARNEATNAHQEFLKVQQAADDFQGQVNGVQNMVDQAMEAAGRVHEEVVQAQQAAGQSQLYAGQAEESVNASKAEVDKARKEADRAKKEADRAKEAADSVTAGNELSGTLESVTSSAVTFNREVASRSHLRCMTKDGKTPFAGVWRSGVAELYMTVDSTGNTGFTTGAPSDSPAFRAYWDKQGSTYVSTSTMNIDNGSRQIKGSLEVGQGSNSSIHTFSKGDGAQGDIVSGTKWKWQDGGLEAGTVRGTGSDCTGTVRTTSGGRTVSYQQDAKGGIHVFFNGSNAKAMTIHENGDIETPLLGRLSEKLSSSAPSPVPPPPPAPMPPAPPSQGGGGYEEIWSDRRIGTLKNKEESMFRSPASVKGKRGYVRYNDEEAGEVRVFFTYPPMDCTFQLNIWDGKLVVEMANNGMTFVRRGGDGIADHEVLTFYVDDSAFTSLLRAPMMGFTL